MLAPMEQDDPGSRLLALFAELGDAERQGLGALRCLSDAPAHPLAPWALRLHELRPTDADEVDVLIYMGSAAALQLGAADLEAVLLQAVQEHVDDRAAAREIPGRAALYEAQAAWRLGQAPSAGWYRRGEALSPCAWAVDNDVFVEVAAPRAQWMKWMGSELALHVGGESLALSLPDPEALDEIWTIEGAGLFEPDPDVTLEELEEARDDGGEVPGSFGDLHVVPVVYDPSRWRSA